jgi:hypothetical protein
MEAPIQQQPLASGPHSSESSSPNPQIASWLGIATCPKPSSLLPKRNLGLFLLHRVPTSILAKLAWLITAIASSVAAWHSDHGGFRRAAPQLIVLETSRYAECKGHVYPNSSCTGWAARARVWWPEDSNEAASEWGPEEGNWAAWVCRVGRLD